MAPDTASHLEVEQTFETTASTEVPDLQVDGVTTVTADRGHDLAATYHDTADLRLLRAGITLRRRLGGSDEGWHLKVAAPGSSDTRLELRRPAGRSRRPPIPIRRLVLGAARGAELVPIADIRTHRVERHLEGTDGRVLAVLADDAVSTRVLLDQGTARAPEAAAWREIEVELVDGDRDLLAAAAQRLGEAGIHPSRVQSKLRRALGDRLPVGDHDDGARGDGDGGGDGDGDGEQITAGSVLRTHLERLRDALTAYDVHVRAQQADGVHQLRIAARRIRSVLAAYRPLFVETEARRLEAELRWLGLALSTARDLEVTDAELAGLLAGEPADRPTRNARQVARRHLRHTTRGVSGEVGAVLTSERYLRLLDQLADLTRDPPLTEQADRPARGRLRRRARKAYRRLAGRMETAGQCAGGDRDRALHEARKAAKRLRYALEVAEPVIGKPARRLRKRTKHLQQPLGAHHDSVVLRVLVRELATSASSPAAFTLGRVHARLQHRAEELDEDGLAAWSRLSTPKMLRWLH